MMKKQKQFAVSRSCEESARRRSWFLGEQNDLPESASLARAGFEFLQKLRDTSDNMTETASPLTARFKKSNRLDVDHGSIVTNCKVNRQRAHQCKVDDQAQGRQAINWFAELSRILFESAKNSLERVHDFFAAALAGRLFVEIPDEFANRRGSLDLIWRTGSIRWVHRFDFFLLEFCR
jgi:hypothetical protein